MGLTTHAAGVWTRANQTEIAENSAPIGTEVVDRWGNAGRLINKSVGKRRGGGFRARFTVRLVATAPNGERRIRVYIVEDIFGIHPERGGPIEITDWRI